MAIEPLHSTLLYDRLPDWWRPFALDLDGAIVARRRRVIVALREALAPGNSVDAVAFAHGDDDAGERIIGLLRHTARSEDPRYDGRVGDAEPPALVAAALADQLASAPDTDLSTLISLLVLSAAYSDRTPPVADMPLRDYASRQLTDRSAAVRAGRAQPAPPVADLVQRLSADAAGGPEAQHEIVVALAARVDELAAHAAQQQAVLHDQMRQHRWATSPWCQLAGVAWCDLEPSSRPLIAAVELADHTHGVTPAPDATELIGEVLRTAGSEQLGVTAAGAVAAAAPLLEGRLSNAPHRELFPIASALADWRAGAAPHDDISSAGQPSAATGEALRLAAQAHHEVLALRALGYD